MDNETLASMDLCFDVEYREKDQLFQDELVLFGSQIAVDKHNVKEYAEARINHFVWKQLPFINLIKNGFYSIIPYDLLKNFNEVQLELILNGQPFIDVDDWELNSIFTISERSYHKNHQTIILFWKALRSMEQASLSKFLHFCTGTSKVPIGGFAALESNRGQITKFSITHVPLKRSINKKKRSSKGFNMINSNNNEVDMNNLIKAHTCFNRIDLPEFTDFSQVKRAIDFVVENEILGFGLD